MPLYGVVLGDPLGEIILFDAEPLAGPFLLNVFKLMLGQLDQAGCSPKQHKIFALPGSQSVPIHNPCHPRFLWCPPPLTDQLSIFPVGGGTYLFFIVLPPMGLITTQRWDHSWSGPAGCGGLPWVRFGARSMTRCYMGSIVCAHRDWKSLVVCSRS